MKLLNLVISVLLLLGITNGCKYENGPLISFKSKKKRLVNEWKLEKYLRNDKDRTSKLIISNYEETYTKDGRLIRTFKAPDGDNEEQDGNWEFGENKKVIDIGDVSSIKLTNETSTVSASELEILKLTSDKLWYKFENGGDVHEFHLVSK